ncbi:hypothetical protein LPB140_06190 [Sphingorhabdus lutea]|uniref:Uncharacterized protein n=1 Tax=Sphingorhabdus lutea TaxID=1913578 RepID=A0A1L3JET4_9SPHN|nr:hypothetical protein LPB140_06190 [Sphingorhabdus lutea]
MVISLPYAETRILIIPPLFDEMNRMRRFICQFMTSSISFQLGSTVLDLPGCNESLQLLANQDLEIWQQAVAVAATRFQATHILSFRGGTLIDHVPNLPIFRVAPCKGRSLLSTLMRTEIITQKEMGNIVNSDHYFAQSKLGPICLAGNMLGTNMVNALQNAQPHNAPHVHTIKIGNGDNMISGSALWLRAEPGEDEHMANMLAAHIAANLHNENFTSAGAENDG